MGCLERLVSTGIRVVLSNKNGQIKVWFEDLYTKNIPVLQGDFGCGKTIEEAAEDYLEKIKGHYCILHPDGKSIDDDGSRREIIFL